MWFEQGKQLCLFQHVSSSTLVVLISAILLAGTKAAIEHPKKVTTDCIILLQSLMFVCTVTEFVGWLICMYFPFNGNDDTHAYCNLEQRVKVVTVCDEGKLSCCV